MSQKKFKCVIVGDGTVGKTCMVVSYTQNTFPTGYVPTVIDSYDVELNIGDTMGVLTLFDTAGQEDYERLRLLTYPDADVFIICFSVVHPDSFVNVQESWVPEITQHRKQTPILLVGTKVDLRNDPRTVAELSQTKQTPISPASAERTRMKIGAVKYLECSALKQIGLKEVFDEAIRAALKKKKKRRCVLM